MSIAVCLLLYSFAVAVLGPPVLMRLTRSSVAPRLGVLTWLAATGTVLIAWTAAAAFLVGDLVREWRRPEELIGACFSALRQVATGGSGVWLQSGLLILSAAGTLALTAVLLRLVRSLTTARTQTHRHAEAARLVGRRIDGCEAVVLDAPQRAAYCVAGRPHTIVITSAALAALDERHLAAVIEHERAHLAGHHHQILAFIHGVTAVAPKMKLFSAGAREIARLVEMSADHHASRLHGTRTLLEALIALTTSSPIPHGAMGATGGSVLVRAQRLAAPPTPAARWRGRMLLTLASVVTVGGLLVAGGLAVAGLALCNLTIV